MSLKTAITISNQSFFEVEKDLVANEFDYEDYETVEKITSVILENSSLMGEYVISEEGQAHIIYRAKKSFLHILNDITLDMMDKRTLTLASVILTQNFSDDDGGKLWEFILQNLDCPKEDISKQKYQNRLKESIKEVLIDSDRFFCDEGQQYYNTINIHALSPEWSIEHFFNILYDFYNKNLLSNYVENDTCYKSFVNNICRRWDNTKERGNEVKLRSDILSSSFKMLFKLKPNYMAAISDSITRKMDALLKGEPILDIDTNRWDLLLWKWYIGKTSAEKEKMEKAFEKANRGRVATRKADIKPVYYCDDDHVVIKIPKIRLPEINSLPKVTLYQDNSIVYQTELDVFGDDLCYTTYEHTFFITENDNINWNKPFNFRLVITTDNECFYDTKTDLFRQNIFFNSKGNEIKKVSENYDSICVLTNKCSYVRTEYLSEDNFVSGSEYQLWHLNLGHCGEVLINGISIFDHTKESFSRPQIILSNSPFDKARVLQEGKEYSIFTHSTLLEIHISNNDNEKNYYLLLDGVKHALFEYKTSEGIEIPLSEMTSYYHEIIIKRFSDTKTVYSLNYVFIRGFSIKYDKAFYFNDYVKDACITLSANGKTKSFKETFYPDQNEVRVEWMTNYLFIIDIPRVLASANGKNAYLCSSRMWHDDLEYDFIKITCPVGYTASLLLFPDEVPSTKRGLFDLRNYVTSISTRDDERSAQLVIFVRDDLDNKLIDKYHLTTIYFKESLVGNPLIVSERRIDWDVKDFFIGPRKPEFKVLLENETKKPWEYSLDSKKSNLEKVFPCKEGVYGYKIYYCKHSFFNNEEILLESGALTIGDPNKTRFDDCELILDKVACGDSKAFDMKYNAAIIENPKYIGLCKEKPFCGMPQYTGTLCFNKSSTDRVRFSDKPNSNFELINPISFFVFDDNHLSIKTVEKTDLMIALNYREEATIVNKTEIARRDGQSRSIMFAEQFRYHTIKIR